MSVPPERLGGSPSKARHRPSSSYYAAQYIRRLIFEGHLRPGQRIPQDEVAKALSLSRIPVREAIIALEREGFVTTELHRGAYVNALDERAVLDQYALYGIVYGFAARRALERSPEGFLDELRSLAAELGAVDDPSEVGRVSTQFHRVVIAAAASPRIRVAIRSMPGLRPDAFFALVPGAVEAQQRGIKLVLEAFEAGDADLVCERYAVVMEELGDQVVELFRSRNMLE